MMREATPAQLEQAIALNHSELFRLEATLGGNQVNETHGVMWTHAAKDNNSMIAFPALSPENAGSVLDDIITEYLHDPPKGVLCWSLDPPQPDDLSVRLLARGFQIGWTPGWMVLDLDTMQTDHPVPQELRVMGDNTSSLQHIKGLPYAEDSNRTIIPPGLQADHTVKLQRFVATLRGEIVAHTSVLLTTGEYGVAGIYNVGVLPFYRNQGIGKAVVVAACLYAREQGYRYATLNGTGRRMYEQIGFKWLKSGLTWWLNVERLLSHPPTKDEVLLVEAIGRADMETLERLGHGFNNDELSKPMTNAMTLMQIAIQYKQPSSAKWLMTRGVLIKVLEAWDIGWKELAKQMLLAHPEYTDQVYGEFELTILHEAAKRDDIELARLVLSFNPDLTIKDKIYKGTPLDWANYFKRRDIIDAIRMGVKKHG